MFSRTFVVRDPLNVKNNDDINAEKFNVIYLQTTTKYSSIDCLTEQLT